MSDKIRPHHLERKAVLYIRQSSAHQVVVHQNPDLDVAPGNPETTTVGYLPRVIR
jgi:hypothetical protein